MSLFEKDGEIFKNVPAGGHGGGITSYATVKASEAEAAAFRAALVTAEVETQPEADAASGADVTAATDATS